MYIYIYGSIYNAEALTTWVKIELFSASNSKQLLIRTSIINNSTLDYDGVSCPFFHFSFTVTRIQPFLGFIIRNYCPRTQRGYVFKIFYRTWRIFVGDTFGNLICREESEICTWRINKQDTMFRDNSISLRHHSLLLKSFMWIMKYDRFALFECALERRTFSYVLCQMN